MDISTFKPAFAYTIYIASTPEKVWQALTSAEFSRQYFSGFAVELEQKVGGMFRVLMPDGSLHISGEVITCDPPRKLVITTLTDEARPQHESVYTWNLAPSVSADAFAFVPPEGATKIAIVDVAHARELLKKQKSGGAQ